MTMLPDNLPDVSSAKLPSVYEAAKLALAECENIDECKDWGDKAAALASYAKQANDDELERHAMRIKARAIRRCGELLKQYDGRGRPENKDGTVPVYSQSAAGRDAGMSERQVKTAVRVANVPEPVFDRAVESEKPPTVTALAEIGRVERKPVEKQAFVHATHVLGEFGRLAEFCRENAAAYVATGIAPFEVQEIKQHMGTVRRWIGEFQGHLKGDQS